MVIDDVLRPAILQQADAETLRKCYGDQQGYVRMREVAEGLVRGGLTDAAEIGRVFGEG